MVIAVHLLLHLEGCAPKQQLPDGRTGDGGSVRARYRHRWWSGLAPVVTIHSTTTLALPATCASPHLLPPRWD